MSTRAWHCWRERGIQAYTHAYILWPRTDDQQDLTYTLLTEVTCDKNNHIRAHEDSAFVCTAEVVMS